MSVVSACDFAEVQGVPQSFCANDVAALNILFMVVTLDTSHLEISPLNLNAD